MRLLLLLLAVASVPALAQSASETEVATQTPAQPIPAQSSEKWFRDPGVSRSLFGPTGFSLKYGERLLKVEEIYLAFELGLADHFSVELGTMYTSWLVGGLNGAVGVKWATDLDEHWHVAASALAGAFYWSPPFTGAMGLGTVTYGSPDANVTCSLGAALTSAPLSSLANPVGEVALYYRLARNFALETEHWFVLQPGRSSWMSMAHAGGVRLMFESVAIHAGAMSITTLSTSALGGGTSVWPWVGVTWLTSS